MRARNPVRVMAMKKIPRQEHSRQRLLPCEAKSQRHGPAERISEEEVLAHARRQRYGVVSGKPHQHRRHRRREAGGREHGLEILPETPSTPGCTK